MRFPIPHRGGVLVALLACLALVPVAKGEGLTVHSGTGGDQVRLNGADDRAQIVVMAKGDRDVTRNASYTIEPTGVAEIDAGGWLRPLRNGAATLTARVGETETASIPISVEKFDVPRVISFPNDVVPVFTRNHCNAGACHAKAAGQNGFHLSLLGYEPENDYEQIVTHGRGRRVNPSAPEFSLVLMKACGDIPHEGGARLDKEGADYQTILAWVEKGLPFKPDDDPVVEGIDIYPQSVVTTPGSEQQLSVTGRYSDGTTRDLTRLVQYEANQPEMAEAGEDGLISIKQKTGTTAILVRFQEHIATFTATIPLGSEVKDLPKPKNFIDEHIFERLSLMGLPPSPLIDDGMFVRRVTLDITGRLPTQEETNAFLASTDPEKRARKIDELLDSTDYADFFAGKWAGILRNKVERGVDWIIRDSHAFYAWIRNSLIENKPYDQFASELIVASGKEIENPAVNWYRVVGDQKERMENLAQVFLGIRMQCAQCHHHPYEQWSQDDYYSFTAFFSTIETKNIRKLPEEDIYFHNRKAALMENPATGEKLKPRLLGAPEPVDIPAARDPRFELADWMRSKDNPYFARMLVNRYWKHFFSRGLVEPEDDIRPSNPATHPKLLEDLADHFADSGFDLKDLIRTICNSRTYQLSSMPNDQNEADEQNFARYYPKRLPAEVLLDSVNDITGAKNSFSKQPAGVRAIALPNEKGTVESEFLMMFGRPAMDTACECERTSEANLGQSLHLLNSDTIQTKLTANDGIAAKLAKETDRPDQDRLTELYLHALSRKPAEPELKIALDHLDRKRKASAADPKALTPEQAERQAWEDIVWVLINTKEFMFNR
ncbi:MAG: DUF1553 domain-containing protein [Verrucomicrobiae bacterium]|nr:DUF1553 domain-containing protein [Verrucomicrobiae bacterium]